MPRALPRTNFNSSKLLRLLDRMDLVVPAEQTTALGEQLAPWLDLNDAITLYAALNESGPMPGIATDASAGLLTELMQLRAQLEGAVRNSCAPVPHPARLRFPVPGNDLPREIAADYEPYRRFYLAHQRGFEATLKPLRQRTRDSLARAKPALRTLAALDGVFDTLLAERERTLLAAVPAQLEHRFARRRDAYLQAVSRADADDEPSCWLQPGAWLAEFRSELEALLLAELDLRLQPIFGLIEALNHETDPFLN